MAETTIPLVIRDGATHDDLALAVIDLVRKVAGPDSAVIIAFATPPKPDGTGDWRVRWDGDVAMVLRLTRTASDLVLEKFIPVLEQKEA